MQAAIIDAFGGPEVFEIRDVDRPAPGPEEVLIRVHATSVNPVDTKIRAGGRSIAPDLPAILHGDVAGVIEAVGDHVTSLRTGDAVYGCARGVKGSGGALAEYMVADPRLLAIKPERLSFREAAALPLVTLTAWEGLIEKAQIGPNDHVLIMGGTGGVGHVAIQIAKLRGATVTAQVGSAEKAEIARALGADYVANRHEQSVAEIVSERTLNYGFDVVFDTVGGDNLYPAMEAVRLNGQIVTTVAMQTFDLTTAHVKGLSIHVVFMLIPLLHDLERSRHGAILRAAARHADARELRPLLDDRSFGLADVGAAHARLESGAATGKVVVDVG